MNAATLPAPSRPEDVVAVGMLEKGLAVLTLVAERGDATVVAIGGAVGLSRSAAYRLVDRLRTAGYLEDGRVAGTVRLGANIVPIGLAALRQLDVMTVAPPLLMALAREAGETVNLAVPRADEMVYVHQAEGPGAVRVTAHLGTRRPMGCSALGKAYLAALPASDLDERLRSLPLVRLTHNSPATTGELREAVSIAAAQGYATDDEEVELGVACVGAAVRDHTGRPVAAVSVAGPAERMPANRERIVAALLKTTAGISTRLGYRS